MTLPVITALPTPPSRNDTPATFNANADAFLFALPTFQQELNAYRAALPGTITGTDYSATSTTSLAIGTGSKSLTIETGKNFQIGQSVRIASTATPANYMDGQVTAHNNSTGALTVSVSAIGGTGTLAAWTISLAVSGGGVSLTGSETLTNKTLTTPVISGTASGTVSGRIGYSSGALTFGDGTAQRTVATLDGSQTFTNKTLDTAGGNVFKINGNTLDAAAGTATITIPNANDTLVGRNTTDTLANKTLTAPVINGGTVTPPAAPAAANPGYIGLPQVAITASRTLALSDIAKEIYISGTTAAQTVTIPANGSVAFPIGTVIVITNDSNQNWSIAITTDTLAWSPTLATGTRTLAAGGSATLSKKTATRWWIAGSGLT
ncbi:hypothetical protein ACQKOE_13780 [Novosphingobium sp. NPDC080210]|uniref:hypothetical protein n=1 Tax=Novosphingobium sp. NPDC080210 TaxID=3390596 RepID=UPI003D09162B